jgi:hypothetical protein
VIIVTRDYSYKEYNSIKESEMSDNFIIRIEYLKRVWDIDPGIIGISFFTIYDEYKYRIILEGESKTLLAKDIIKLVREGIENYLIGVTTITGIVKHE